MELTPFARERNVAIAAVREAARLCRAVQAEMAPDVLQKKDRSPVTVADFGSQALVCRKIRTAFPDDPIMAEEDAAALRSPENAALAEQVAHYVQQLRPAEDEMVLSWIDAGNLDEQRDRFWTLDPIDGTKGFLRGEQYAVALALIEDGEPVVAAVACPNLPEQLDVPGGGTVFAAIKGQGTFQFPIDGNGHGDAVQVSATADTTEARFCESFVSAHSSHDDAASVAERLGITKDPVRIDSQAKYALVARGDADIYLRLPTGGGYVEKIWDHAAGSLVVQEAGGTVTDIHGKPLAFRYGRTLAQNTGIIVTNGMVHAEVLDALHAVGVA